MKLALLAVFVSAAQANRNGVCATSPMADIYSADVAKCNACPAAQVWCPRQTGVTTNGKCVTDCSTGCLDTAYDVNPEDFATETEDVCMQHTDTDTKCTTAQVFCNMGDDYFGQCVSSCDSCRHKKKNPVAHTTTASDTCLMMSASDCPLATAFCPKTTACMSSCATCTGERTQTPANHATTAGDSCELVGTNCVLGAGYIVAGSQGNILSGRGECPATCGTLTQVIVTAEVGAGTCNPATYNCQPLDGECPVAATEAPKLSAASSSPITTVVLCTMLVASLSLMV